jgi:hypothetical protein|tara:strand:+ start:915 stop:2555 length:1641 start_codon:yes stop_codon:yes gene_type:complete
VVNKVIKSGRIPVVLVGWNMFDAILHIAIDMAEPMRIAGNTIAILVAITILLGAPKKLSFPLLLVAFISTVALNTVHVSENSFAIPMLVFIGLSLYLLLRLAQISKIEDLKIRESEKQKYFHKRWFAVVLSLFGVLVVLAVGVMNSLNIQDQLFDGALKEADYWSDEPVILSAGMGFEGIIGWPEVNEETVREAEGSWYGSVMCTNGEVPPAGAYTSTVSTAGIELFYKGTAEDDDGLPIVFSWPVATETVDITDFQFTLNTGEIVFPNSAGMLPNWELNERNTVVVFGDFGNRGLSSEEGAIFPVRLDIVKDETPLLLVGPNGQEFNAVGLSWETDTSPYDSGPKLVGAKLNHVGNEALGEGGLGFGTRSGVLPNDELSLYDESDFRIRVLTTGGFSPDGITGLTPTMFEDFFRIHAKGSNGEVVLLEKVGQEYLVAGGTLRIVGLSDLGQKENPDEGIFYDDCYAEDRDNYIDIILVGDEAAARNITHVEIPSLEGGYSAFYNPGGPGPEPFDGVRYTAPGPADLEPVINALDNPMRISREPKN